MSDVEALMNKGNKYYDNGRFNDALDVYLRIIDTQPDNIDGLINVGLCYRHLERYDDAIDYYNKVLDIEPENATALNNKGYVYECQGEIEKAIVLYEKSLEIDPNYDRPLINLTNIYIDRKEYDKTVPIYENALKVDPINVPNWIDLGRAYRFLEMYSESINAYNHALKIDPYSKIAWNNIGYAYFCMEDYDNAIHAYTKSMKIEWLYDLPFTNLIKIYDEMRKSNDTNAVRWYNVAKGFYIGRAYNRAIDAIYKTIELNPESEDARKLKKNILKDKKKVSFNEELKKVMEDAINMFAFTSTSVYIGDFLEYVKYKFDKNIFEDQELLFRLHEFINEKGLWAKIEDDKLRFYRQDDGKSKVNYL